MSIQIFFGEKTLHIGNANISFDTELHLASLKDDLTNFWASNQLHALVRTNQIDKTLDELCKLYTYIEAAGGLVKNSEGAFLLMYRLGKWDLPKGKAEKGEEIRETALREVQEETGVHGLEIEKEIPSTYHMYQLKGKTVLKRTYWYLMQTKYNGELLAQTEENIEKVEWLSKKHFSKVYENTYPSVMNVLKYA